MLGIYEELFGGGKERHTWWKKVATTADSNTVSNIEATYHADLQVPRCPAVLTGGAAQVSFIKGQEVTPPEGWDA